MLFSRQCCLEKEYKSGTINQVSWIPEQFAKIGKTLKLLNRDTWEDGWKVIAVGARQSKQERIDRALDYKRQRKASDI